MSTPPAGVADPGSRAPHGDEGWPNWQRVALGGGGGMFVGMGLGRFSYTAMVPPLISAGELTALEAGHIGMFNLAGFALGALVSVPLRTRFNDYRTLVFAIVLSVLALAGSALPLGFAWLAICRGLVGFAGGIIMVLSLALITATAPANRRPVAAGFVFAGVGGAILSTGILVPWLLGFGLKAAWLGLAVCAVAAATLAVWGWSAAPRGAATASASHAPRVAASPWTLPLILLVAGHLCFSVAIVPHTLYWVDYLARGLGLGIAEGGFHWSLVGIASILGPWIAAALGLWLGTSLALPLSFMAIGVGIAAPLVSSAGAVLLASSLLFGAQPGLSVLLAARVRDLADADQMPYLMRAVILASALGAVFAGMVLPLIYAATASHVLVFALGGATMILGGILVAPFWRPKASP